MKKNMFLQGRPVITSIEMKWVITLSVVVAGITMLPYLNAALFAKPGLTFGGVIVNPLDGNTYLAKARQGYDGNWLYHLAYTPESEPGIFVYTIYILIGHIAKLTGISIVVVYHLVRFLAGVLLFIGIYRLACEISAEISTRRWAWFIAAFGSGLGILTFVSGRAINGQLPVDFYSPESNLYYSLLANPHFPLIAALEVWLLTWIVNPPFADWPDPIHHLITAALGLGIVSMAAYLGPVIGLVATVLTVSQGINRTALIRIGVLGIAMIALELVNLWQIQSNPAVSAWLAQAPEYSSSLADTLLGQGLWLPLAPIGAWLLWKQGEKGPRSLAMALLFWIGLSLILMYVPFQFQRRFVGGLFIPISILAGAAVPNLFGRLESWTLKITFALVVGLGFCSNTLITAAAFTAARQAQPTMYLSADEVAVFDWLRPRVTQDDVVLADERLGNFIPAWTSARSVYGHSAETANAAARLADVRNYYAKGSDPNLLRIYPIKYVIGGLQPSGWRIVFQTPSITVYGQ